MEDPEDNDCDLVVANFKVSGEEVKEIVNSDMGSDCAYFSGPDQHSEQEDMDYDDQIDADQEE